MDTPANTRSPRLNPFAFPSDTTFRFLLLIASVIGASAFFYDSIFFSFNAHHVLETLVRCQETANAAHPFGSDANRTLYDVCRAPVSQMQATWTLIGLALIISAAVVIYLVMPAWKIWRNQLAPLTSQDAPEIIAYLITLCTEMKLVHIPVFLCAPLNGAVSGLVFGRLGRYYLSLNGGLIAQFYKDRETFRAVVMHELAHLRNADVDKTYFSVAVWHAFVAVALVPYAASVVFRPPGIGPADTAYLMNVVFRFFALAGLVYLTFKALLRAREVYADIRASTYEGLAGSLDRVLATLSRPRASRWWWFTQAHPDPNKRRRTLVDITGLFRIGFWEAIGTGVIIMIAFSNIYLLLSSLTVGKQNLVLGLTGGEFATYGAALVFAPMVAGVIVVGIWRDQFAALVGGASPSGVSHLGVGLASGAVLGHFLAIHKALESQVVSQVSVGSIVSALGYKVLWVIVILVYLLFLVHWVANATSVWLELAISVPSPRQIYITIIITSALLVIMIGPLYLLYTVGLPLAQDGDLLLALILGVTGSFMVSAVYPHSVMAFIILWAFPFAGRVWRNLRTSTTPSPWVFLDPPPPIILFPSEGKLRIRPAFLAGLVGGLLWCGFVIGIDIIANFIVPEFTQTLRQQIYLLFAVGAFAQMISAVVAASLIKQLRVVHGLFTAFIAGCVITGGLTLLQLLWTGGTVSAGFLWILFSNVIGMGALLTLPFVGLLSTSIEWVNRLRFEFLPGRSHV